MAGVLPTEIAVIDIGSNAVRLVIFDAADVAPIKRHVERAMCGLGVDMTRTGRLSPHGVADSIATLKRFADTLKTRGTSRVRAIATAAVRDASDGPQFVKQAASETGITVEILSGAEEARISALGVVSAMPEKDALIGDFGGGSLELVLVKNRVLQKSVSLPIGSQRLLDITDAKQRQKHIRQQLRQVKWLDDARQMPLYAVGGSWRALGKAHMEMMKHPVPVLDQYIMHQSAALQFCARTVEDKLNDPQEGEDIGAGAEVLIDLLKSAQASSLRFSASGLREGLLFDQLTPEDRSRDALILSCCKLSGFYGAVPSHLSRLDKAAFVLARWAKKAKTATEVFDVLVTAPLLALSHEDRVALALRLVTLRGEAVPQHPALALLDAGTLQRSVQAGKKL